MIKTKKALIWGMFYLYCAIYVYITLMITLLYKLSFELYSIFNMTVILLPLVGLLFMQWLVWKFASIKNKDRVKKAFVIVTTFALIPIIACFVVLGINESSSNFSQSRWLKYESQRVYMVDDLLSNYSLVGKTREDVTKLLGSPTKDAYFMEPNNIVYYLGDERGIFSIDSEWLVIGFDKNDRVIKFEVLRD